MGRNNEYETKRLNGIYNRFFKRVLDIVCSFLAITVFSVIYIPICIIIKCTSEGPIFFKQKRVGKDKSYFNILKFRTMRIDTPKDCPTHLLENPDRYITKVGRFLRKTSLDELPQIFNILKGDMSLVGPRPVTEPELVKYGKYQDYVLSVLPGLSGMWQISGRSDTGYEERISFDSYYIQNWSIWLDMWILLKTVWVVLSGKGAY